MPAGRLLARSTAIPTVALSAWLLVAFPLLVVGHFTPMVALLLGLPAVLAAAALVTRWVPDLPEDTPWWPVAAIGAITVAFAAVQVAYRSEQLVIRRDAASYAQFTTWIARNGFLPVPQGRGLLAGDDPALSYGSLAYYQVGEDIWPQFLSGAPLTYSVGHWLGGVEGMLVAAPLVGALGVLTFGGLAARLVGPRWAPLAALLLAVCLPQQWVSRSTYSEPVAQVLLLGGLVLAYDALARRGHLRDRWGSGHALAAAAGLTFGLGLVTRVDALRDILPVLVFIGLLLLARRAQALPMLAGLAVGGGYGYVASYTLSRPYIEYLSDSVRPLLLLSAGVLALTILGVLALWRFGVPRSLGRTWIPTSAAALAVAVMVGFALRPLVRTERGHGTEATGDYIGYVQEIEGLEVDPGRTYEEMSLYWVGWYLGLAALLLATLAVALLVRRALRGTAPQWVLPLMVFTWSAATTLARPAITPDHPWASRRLVVLVLPAFVLLSVWALAWVAKRLRMLRPRPSPLLRGAAVAIGAVSLLAPTAVTAAGVMTYRTDAGSVAAVERLCRGIPADGSVIIVDPGVASGFTQLIRGMCEVPAAHLNTWNPDDVQRVLAAVRDRGRTPVLAGASPEQLAPHTPEDAQPRLGVQVDTEQDPSTLMEPPSGAWRYGATVYTVTVPEP